MSMLFDYIQLILSFFVITFFLDNIITYIKSKDVPARKVFTVRKGGLFQHYYIVIVLTLLTAGFHALGYNPFLLDNLVGIIIQGAMFYVTIVLFFLIVSMLIGYLFVFFYVRIRRVENFDTLVKPHLYRAFIIMLSSALIFGLILLVTIFSTLE